MNIPTHVAIIPDGNRRWARARGLPTIEGHRRGFDRAIEACRKARELGIKYMTLWAFSTENWKRTQEEVGYLMKLYERMIDNYLKEALKNESRIIHIGRKDRINDFLRKKIIDSEEKTKDFTKNTLIIALDYGGRDEVLRAVNKMMASSKKNEEVTEESLNQYLDSAEIPDVDLIIRTSGELRTSGFMIWKAAYAEYIFLDKHFPDFEPQDLEDCIHIYAERQRRIGK